MFDLTCLFLEWIAAWNGEDFGLAETARLMGDDAARVFLSTLERVGGVL